MNTTRDDKGCYLVAIDGIDVPFDFSMLVIDQFARQKGWTDMSLSDIFTKVIDKPTYGDAIAFFKVALTSAWKKHQRKDSTPTDGMLAEYYFKIYYAAQESMVAFFKNNGIDLTQLNQEAGEAKKA